MIYRYYTPDLTTGNEASRRKPTAVHVRPARQHVLSPGFTFPAAGKSFPLGLVDPREDRTQIYNADLAVPPTEEPVFQSNGNTGPGSPVCLKTASPARLLHNTIRPTLRYYKFCRIVLLVWVWGTAIYRLRKPTMRLLHTLVTSAYASHDFHGKIEFAGSESQY